MLADYACPKCNKKGFIVLTDNEFFGDSEDLSPDSLKCVNCGYVFDASELNNSENSILTVD